MKKQGQAGRAAFLSLGAVAISMLPNSDVLAQQKGPAAVRPGPDILYAAPAKSPQLENTGIWKAAPILVSGTSAYRNGEFLYQDYIYDDRGAAQRSLYPTALQEKTHDNAADLLELRLKPADGATAIRITYNTLLDLDIVATTIAFGDAVKAASIPHGAGGTEPATIFVTVHGKTGVITDAASGRALGSAAVTIDMRRRQVDIRVPYSAFDPRNKTVRVAAGTGLWDTAKNAYRGLGETAAAPPSESGAEPPAGRGGRGGRGGPPPLPAAHSNFFNAAFRYHEPLNTESQLAIYNDQAQGDALAKGDLSSFYADVDFAKLARGVTDNSSVPVTGFMNRIVVSHFETAQGRGNGLRLDKSCGNPCVPELAGRLQPYSIYVPEKKPPASGYGLTIDLHSSGATYARWIGQQRMVQEGERGTGSIVVTPSGRGSGSFYYGQGGADVFEVWADVARLYKIDPDYVSLSGLSQGAYGSFKLAGQFPDLFAAAAVQVGCPYPTVMRNHALVPFIVHTGDADTNTNCHPGAGGNPALEDWLELNQTYTWWNFAKQPHGFSSIPRDWQPYADFLGMKKRASDPAHVVYGMDGDLDEPHYGLNSDHAYWVSGVTLRDFNHKMQNNPIDTRAILAPTSYGIVDVMSYGFGKSDPVPNPVVKGSGTWSFGVQNYTWPNYTSQEVTWGPARTIPVRDEIDVKAENIATLVIDPKRARISCNARINVTSDGPVSVKLSGCAKANVVMKNP